MVKILSPGFPPRRPSGYVRYILVAGILMLLFYTFQSDNDGYSLGSYPDSRTGIVPPTSPDNAVERPGDSKYDSKGPMQPEVLVPGGSKSGSSQTYTDDDATYHYGGAKTYQDDEDDDDGGSYSKLKIGYDPTIETDDDSKKFTMDKEEPASKSGSYSKSKTAADDEDEDEDDGDADSTLNVHGSSKQKIAAEDDDEEDTGSYSNSKTSGSTSKHGSSKTTADDEDDDDVEYSSSKGSSKSKTGSKHSGSKSSAYDDEDEDEIETDRAPKSKTGSSSSSKHSSSKTVVDEDEEDEEETTGHSKSKQFMNKYGSSKTSEDEDEEETKPKKASSSSSEPSESSEPEQESDENTFGTDDQHPIDKLIYDAQLTFAELTSKESKSIEAAAEAYRKRRGRHPPPGFDKWYKFAADNNALIVEDFFDQIYHDLEPFWGLPAKVLRKESWDFEMTINIRNGTASAGSDWFWTQIWLNMIKTIEHLLPDMDLALNAMDEPRLVVPWEDIDGYMKKAAKTVGFPKSKDVVSEFQELPAPGKGDKAVETRDKAWEGTRPYWAIARRGCDPESEARINGIIRGVERPPDFRLSNADAHSYQGYVSNFTLSQELCHQPDLQALEGILISPLSVSATKTMFPMFGGSKLTVNNEILLPAPMYWNEEERFTGGDDHGIAWKDKKDKVIWRGVATGGKNTEENWTGFQRHRFVAMSNGTTITAVEAGEKKPENFVMPIRKYGLSAQKERKLGEWIDEWADVSFIDLMCDPPTDDGSCSYTGHYFKQTQGLKMSEQFDNKFLPDIDGNSFSGRYLGFLRSTSLPVKATLWREWHDSRLVAWKHFVPMDSRFHDFYGIMEYFLGYGGKGGHDRAAEKIATEGKEWAEQVLRKEDMQIYVLRLLLEYARILDDNRENLGWVEDILKDPSLERDSA